MVVKIQSDTFKNILRRVEKVEGALSLKDIRFLATAAANPTADGDIVELGTFKGKSTALIALAARLAPTCRFATVDPFPEGRRFEAEANLVQAGVRDEVEVFEMMSHEFTKTWRESIRLLFHDGANELNAIRQDIRELKPYFANGAIIAFHDVLNLTGHRCAAFAEDILASDEFGAAGCCGGIGWAQFTTDPAVAQKNRRRRQKLRQKLERLVPFLRQAAVIGDQGNYRPSLLAKWRYKLARARVPHRRVQAHLWHTPQKHENQESWAA